MQATEKTTKNAFDKTSM